MLAAKIIIIGILLMSVGNVYAWDEEGGLTEGEKYDIMFNSWSTYQDALHPKWYDPIADPIKEYLIKFESYFIYTPPDTEVLIMIKKWSYRDGAYHEEDIYWQDAKNLVWDTNRTEIPIVTVNPMEEFFKNNTEEIDNFTTVDDDPIHPDVLNVTVTVDTDGTLYDMTKSGYFTLDDDSLSTLEDQITNPDYGFALDGRGSDGSSGSIYEGINMYAGTGDETGMGKGFGWIFFGLIPIIFIFAILKFARRIVGD
jgi:hypothetical protein